MRKGATPHLCNKFGARNTRTNKCNTLYRGAYLVLVVGNGQEGGPEADGQVVGVHEVLIAVLGEVAEEGEEVAHDYHPGGGERVDELLYPLYRLLGG